MALKRLGVKWALSVVLLMVSVGIWVARRPIDLAVAARQLFEAQLIADGPNLLKLSLREEIAANSLTAEKAGRLYRELILPRLGVSGSLKPTRIIANASKGSASSIISTKQGGSVEFEADVYLVDDGVGSPITQRLFVAWQKSYYDDHKAGDVIMDRISAILDGYKADRERLAAIGIRALCDVDYGAGKVKLIPLDGLERQYGDWRNSLLESRKAKVPSK